MSRGGALRAGAIAALALALAGCGGSPSRIDTGPPAPEPAPTGTGYFVGTGPDGLGATLDLLADDPTTRAVGDALVQTVSPPERAPAVGIASVVNDDALAAAAPSFIALFPGGGALPIIDARTAIEDARGPVARRARALLGTAPRRVPAGGAITQYVVLRDVEPAEVDAVRMASPPLEPIPMEARRR